jgi:predicted unusual protein kinase regulating ubiquinone biosynthesis (AarF/ABC1/UbiB family)
MLRASSICMSLIYKYITSSSESKDDLTEKSKKLRLLSETFAQYGGVLSKIAQILVLNDTDNDVFSDCKPFSREKTHNYIVKQFENNREFFRDVDQFNFEIYKSGSVGQVYRATTNQREIVMKVQYQGLAEQTRQDLKILDMVVDYLYSDFADMKNAIIDIKTKINEELDYQNEKRNQQYVYQAFLNNFNINIPEIIESLCTDKILTMEYMDDYKVLNEFITNSTQEQRNEIGILIIKFIFESLFKHHILYPDSHYGNFLVKTDASSISVLDFGCLVYIEPELIQSLKQLHYALKSNDKYRFLEIIQNLGIINQNTSEESKDYAFEYFKLQYEPLLTDTDNFQFYPEWLELVGDKNIELMKEWFCPSNMIYLHKIPYGLYHLLTKLELNCNVGVIIEELLNSI